MTRPLPPDAEPAGPAPAATPSQPPVDASVDPPIDPPIDAPVDPPAGVSPPAFDEVDLRTPAVAPRVTPAPAAPVLVELSPAQARARRRGRLARIAGAVGVLAVTGAVTAAGFVAPIPADVAVAPRTVAVPPAARTFVCAGALSKPAGAGVGNDSAFDPTPVDTLTDVRALSVAGGTQPGGAAPSGTLSLLAGGKALQTLGPVGAAASALRSAGVSGPTIVTVDPVGTVPPRAAAASASLITAGDLRGLAAASCQAPAADQWLVGGSTVLGNSAQLVVANPGATAAQVSVQAFGPSGPVELAGAGQFLVAPGAERALLLEGVAAEQRNIVVNVSAAGGLITAHVQDSRLNGFTPAGVDLVSAGTPPATRQVVGGLVVPSSAIGDPNTAALRLLAPKAGTTARISLLGAQGVVTLPGADRVKLERGAVTDLPLGGLPAGAYTAVIDSGQPVVAAAMITRTGQPGALDPIPTLERAWSAASVPGVDGAVAIPARVDGTVLLAGIGPEPDGSGGPAATGTLRAVGADGGIVAEKKVSLAAGTTVAIPVASLADAGTVAGLDLVLPRTKKATALSWSLLGTVTAADGELVSVLEPVPAAVAPPSVNVRHPRTLGLP